MKRIYSMGAALLRLPRRVIARYRRWSHDPTRRIRSAFGGEKNVFIVQIGANDGCTGDPIRPLLMENQTWRALLVEPVPFLFERLKKNYPDHSRIQFENVAVGEKTGSGSFYFLGEAARRAWPDLPCWHDQLGSFDRGHVMRHLEGRVQGFIEERQIPILSFAELLARQAVEKIDLLHIDVEGFDWVILRQFDLERFAPRVILFEHKHLSSQDLAEACEFLNRRYKIHPIQGDTFCRRRSGSKR